MQLRPILAAMRRNKVGAILIAVQMAVTLAILCNALFIIQERVASSKRPTGVDEANLFEIDNLWVGHPTDLGARLAEDLAALRAVPGVADAFNTNSYPLSDGGSTDGISLHPDQPQAMALSAIYFADEHGLSTLGLKLVAGRDFHADDVVDKLGYTDLSEAPVVIVTRALADTLFPDGHALGQSVYVASQKKQSQIVGIVDRLQVPWTQIGGWGSKFSESSTIEPFRFVNQGSDYLVRAQPGRLSEVMQAAKKRLIDVNRGRVIDEVLPLTVARERAYRDDRGLAIILGVVCTALVLVTAFGIVGLTSYWGAQRRRQIGIRRALGATKQAIVQYFQTENLLIAAAGAGAGIALAVALNLWMVSSFEMHRMHVIYVLAGAFAVLLLGQLAVLGPALRAASIPPALATRGV
jgi:putative ABC transport system permease protein